MIHGVVVKELVTNVDERGFFRELIRVTDDFFQEGFGQLSHALVHAGVAKAWHIHKIQIDWWYVATGSLRVALHDTRPDSPTHRETMELILGEHSPGRVVRVPTGVAHGFRCLAGPCHMFYVTSKVYNPEDEGRIAHDDATIGYDWLRAAPIK